MRGDETGGPDGADGAGTGAVAGGRLPRADARRIAAVGGALVPVPLAVAAAGATYQLRLFVVFLLFALLTVALNVVFAHTDQLFLFLGALAGVGAYATTLTATALGVPALLALPLAPLAAGAVGLVVSYVAARRGMTVIVLAVLTLSLQLAATEFFVGAREITRGSTGLPFPGLGVDRAAAALGVDPRVVLSYLLLAVLLAALAGYGALRGSRYGLAWRAIRQDPVAAEAAGIDVVRQKALAGFLGAALVGLVGPLYAQAEGYVTPSMFAFTGVDVLVLVMLVLGGARTLLGPVVGAAAIVLLEEALAGVGQWRTAVLGLLLIVLFLSFRSGVVPRARALYDEWR